MPLGAARGTGSPAFLGPAPRAKTWACSIQFSRLIGLDAQASIEALHIRRRPLGQLTEPADALDIQELFNLRRDAADALERITPSIRNDLRPTLSRWRIGTHRHNGYRRTALSLSVVQRPHWLLLRRRQLQRPD
ncbi:MAG: hypothetical protein R3D67_07840 [Hyphomicrobiaceae bacterium]